MIEPLLLAALFSQDDLIKKEAEYVHTVKKQEEKEKYEKKIMSRTPSGYMTIEEYELLSIPKDRMTVEIESPNQPTPADMVYVPKPSYKIVRYNNPPGSPELTISPSIYKRMQQNAQGIVSPDFSILVYPSIYYYPNSGSFASDLFVIKLNDSKSNKDKILTANIIHRDAEPILSTDKVNDNLHTFRSLTPIDFSADGTKLLAKEKVGNTRDGIWKTTPLVYDFVTKVSYNLQDVRDAITYYWKGAKDLDLIDKRWDIYPLGFSEENPDWVIVNALAYTGDVPVNLGTWAISYKGESPRLVWLTNSSLPISMNGYKLVKDGVVAPQISENEQKHLKRIEKENKKTKKQTEKNELKELKKSYKAKLKEMDSEFREEQKDYNLRKRINGSTSGNDAIEKYEKIKAEQEVKEQQKLEKLKQKELKELEKQQLKVKRKN